MLGTIGFNGYRISCIIGVEPHERIQEQELIIDLKVDIDFSKVAASGDLKDTIDYIGLKGICERLALKMNYFLIEKYASDVIQEIFNLFPVKTARIRIKKPLAIPGADCALVELKRENKS